MMALKSPEASKVTFDARTWIGLVSLLLGALGMAAGMMGFVFQTQAASIELNTETVGVMRLIVEKHAERPHSGTASKKSQEDLSKLVHKLDKKISVIGVERGLGRDMRRIENEDP